MTDRIFDASFEFTGMLTGGILAGWFMHGRTEFIQAWTVCGAVVGFFTGIGLAAAARALIYRIYEGRWPNFP